MKNNLLCILIFLIATIPLGLPAKKNAISSLEKEPLSKNGHLIFQSGFEKGTRGLPIGRIGSNDLIGVDTSVSPPNNWVRHLEEGNPYIGDFSFQYQGYDPSIILAQIINEPASPSNKVLKFMAKAPNVASQNGGPKTRVQANLYGNTNIKNLYMKLSFF
jgi:hypothetical protein